MMKKGNNFFWFRTTCFTTNTFRFRRIIYCLCFYYISVIILSLSRFLSLPLYLSLLNTYKFIFICKPLPLFHIPPAFHLHITFLKLPIYHYNLATGSLFVPVSLPFPSSHLTSMTMMGVLDF